MTQTHENTAKEQTEITIPRKLVENLLKQAQTALQTDSLEEAQEFYKKALNIPESRFDLAAEIQQMLKQYSDQLTERRPPDWLLSHRAFDLLTSLELENDQTRVWKRDLWLKQAGFFLEQKELEAAFNIFANLMDDHEQVAGQDELKAEISRIVRVNISQRAAQGEWPLLHQIIERVQALWPAEDELHDWLETISEALAAADQAADQAQKEREQLTQQVATLTQAQRRSQTIIYTLIAIFILAAVAYSLILIV